MRIVLWASPGLRAASVFPDPGRPRHAVGSNLPKAVAGLGLAEPDAAELATIEGMVGSALEACNYVSLVRDGATWTAHAVRGQRHHAGRARAPVEALAQALTQADAPPDSAVPATPPPPVRSRVTQPTLF